jgi:Tol biopolymer transport system component
MLDLKTGRRLQVTAPGEGRGVGSWSPDGNWFLGGRGLISADGSEWIVRPWDLLGWGVVGDTVWSPDSRYLAFSIQGGGCEPEGCTPYISKLYVVDLQERKMGEVGEESFSPKPTGMVMRPQWSPDGSQLALMSYSPGCYQCSGTQPALYFATLRKP